jgi:hypothetical protein
MSNSYTHEPDPTRNDFPAVWELIIKENSKRRNKRPIWEVILKEMHERDEMGRAKHGGPLQPFNGRKSLWDAYQELLDLLAYLRQKIWEEEHPMPRMSKEERRREKEKAQTLSPNGYGWYQSAHDENGKIYIYAKDFLSEEGISVHYDCLGYICKVGGNPETYKWAWTISGHCGRSETKKQAKEDFISACIAKYGENYV